MNFRRTMEIVLAGWILAGRAGCNMASEPALTPKQEAQALSQTGKVIADATAAFADAARFTVSAYKLREVDVPPKPIEQVQPIYPVADRNPGKNGTVWIAFIVDTDGTVKQAQVVRTSAVEFGAAALAAVKQWRYKPALKNGVPVRVRMAVPIEFNVAQ